jgi:hypothetical protein
VASRLGSRVTSSDSNRRSTSLASPWTPRRYLVSGEAGSRRRSLRCLAADSALSWKKRTSLAPSEVEPELEREPARVSRHRTKGYVRSDGTFVRGVTVRAYTRSVASANLRRVPVRSAKSTAKVASRLLPSAHRERWAEEYANTLHELAASGASRRTQLKCAMGLLLGSWRMRRALQSPQTKSVGEG